jgi:hypothetical protein
MHVLQRLQFPPHFLMAWCLIKHRYSFAFTSFIRRETLKIKQGHNTLKNIFLYWKFHLQLMMMMMMMMMMLMLMLMLIYGRQSVCLGVRRPSGTRDQFFFLFEISFRQLWVCYFVAPSLTRKRVCNLLYNCFWALPEQWLLGQSSAELTAIFYCLIWDSPPNLYNCSFQFSSLLRVDVFRCRWKWAVSRLLEMFKLGGIVYWSMTSSTALGYWSEQLHIAHTQWPSLGRNCLSSYLVQRKRWTDFWRSSLTLTWVKLGHFIGV